VVTFPVSSTTAPQVVTFEATDDTTGLALDQDHVDVTFVVDSTNGVNSTVVAVPASLVADGVATSDDHGHLERRSGTIRLPATMFSGEPKRNEA